MALKKPDVDHGSSLHKHVWVMLLKKTKLSNSRTVVPAKIASFNAKASLIWHASYRCIFVTNVIAASTFIDV